MNGTDLVIMILIISLENFNRKLDKFMDGDDRGKWACMCHIGTATRRPYSII